VAGRRKPFCEYAAGAGRLWDAGAVRGILPSGHQGIDIVGGSGRGSGCGTWPSRRAVSALQEDVAMAQVDRSMMRIRGQSHTRYAHAQRALAKAQL
jgi:hypothetical protein